jgi:hypothetical protein
MIIKIILIGLLILSALILYIMCRAAAENEEENKEDLK